MTRGLYTVILLVILVFAEELAAQQKNLINSNKCSETVNGVTTYKACASESSFLFRYSPFNLDVSPADYTCGKTVQYYCIWGTNCDVCNANSPTQSHPPEYLTDQGVADSNMSTWWQSITWQNYPTPLEINITMTFNKSYELQDDIIIKFQGSRPQNMIVEKSMDYGQTWQPWQYYDSTCSAGTANSTHPDAVICTPIYSQRLPVTDGEVRLPVTKERLGLFLGPTLTNYQKLYQAYNNTNLKSFLQFTGIRIRLLKPMTDGTPVAGDTRRLWQYYYAIKDIKVVASCVCNMHAKYCVIRNEATVCDCDHNTEGVNCESCKPLYNNKPWKPGYYVPYPFGTANQCEKCECNEHAVSCTYNSTIEFGECDNCTHNTTGVHCEKCLGGFYKNPNEPLNSTNVCTSCDCELLGVTNNNTMCHGTTGQCPCKPNVSGRQCNLCVDNFYGLLLPDSPGTCKACDCNTDGTVAQKTICNHTTGQCPCKQSTTGRQCSGCKDGFYAFPTGKPYTECLPCNCNLGGSTSSVCNKTTGNCNCRANVTGKTCDGTQQGFYVPALDSFQFQPDKGTCVLNTTIVTENEPFTGKKFHVCAENQFVEFQNIAGTTILKQPNITWTYIPAVRYNLFSTAPWQNASLEFKVGGSSSVNINAFPGATGGCTIATGTTYVYDVNMLMNGAGKAWVSPKSMTIDVRCIYTAKLTMLTKGPSTSNVTNIDSLVLFPDHESSSHLSGASNATIDTYNTCIQSFAALSTREAALKNSTCNDLAFSIMSQLTRGSLSCGCNAVGTVPSTTCGPVGGECTCKPGVYGRTCDQCAPGYYNLTAAGCTACNCDPLGSSSLVCDYTTGQCPCRSNVARLNQPDATGSPGGLRCLACLKDFFGKSTGQGCQACGCDSTGSNITQCSDIGKCVCKPTVTGDKCNTCEPGYYGRTPTGCIACNCSKEGSTAVTCHQVSGICSCKNNVLGNKCDGCSANSFNLQSDNPDGCQRCFCYGHNSVCSSATGFSPKMLATADITSWTPIDPNGQQMDLTHRPASAEYLGMKLSSYSRYITVIIQSRANQVIPLKGFQPLMLVGNGKKIYYNATGKTVTPAAQTLRFLLHESNFLYNQTSSPDYFNFYAILADLKGIYFQRKFSTNVVDLSNVTMETTQPAVAGLAVSGGVEKCTCTASRNVRGLSCQNCTQGFKRPTPTGTSYESCLACNCNKRGETTPPICNELTGVCLNCKNGTMGNQCESCSAHVTVASGCTVCEDTFWGLSRTGCQACNCDATGSVNGICNKSNGKCTCKANVIGDKCNMCADNFYNLTTTGCIECNTCYGLVMNEVIDLRQMRDNLTTFLQNLQTNDKNPQLGSFSVRLMNTLNSMGQLSVFLRDAQNIEGPMLKDINRLNVTLNRLRMIVDVDVPVALNQSNLTLINTSQFLGLLNTMIGQINTTLLQTHQLLNVPINSYTQDMMRAVDTLNNSYYQIFGASDSSLQKVIQLSQDVLNIENTTKVSNKLATDTLKLINNTINHHSNNSKSVSDLSTFINMIRNTSLVTNTSAQQAESNAQSVSTATKTVTAELAALSPVRLDLIKSLATLVTDIEKTAANLTKNVSTFTPAEIDIKDVRLVKAQSHAVTLIAEINSLKSRSQVLITELQKLNTDAITAKNGSDASIAAGREMLSIMQNFTQRAAEIEARANNSLTTVQEVTSLSQTAATQAQQIVAQLSGTLTNSQAGLKGVQDALGKASANLAKVQPLTKSADSIQARYNQHLGDIKFKEQSVIFSNITHISPAKKTCDANIAQVATLESQTKLATDKAVNVSKMVNDTQQRLGKLLQNVQSVNTINQKSIDELRTLVLQTRADYDRRELATAVTTLKGQVDAQKQWIANMQTRKLELQAQIQRLKDIKDQLKN